MEFMRPPAPVEPVVPDAAAVVVPAVAADDGAVPPDTEYVLLVALLSADDGSSKCLSLCRLASDLARGLNTSKIVGRRFGEAIPWTVD